MSKKIKNNIEDALISFYNEADKELIDDLLNEHIDDQEGYIKKKKRIKFLAMANAKKQKNDKIQLLVTKVQHALDSNTEKPVAMLKRLIQSNPSFALYRSLDKLSKDDLVEIIKDQNLIQLIEELEKDEKKH
jgi:Mg/Co/Ni transporter MgtE